MTIPTYLTLRQAAKRYHIGAPALWQAHQRGELRCTTHYRPCGGARFGRVLMVSDSAMADWLEDWHENRRLALKRYTPRTSRRSQPYDPIASNPFRTTKGKVFTK